MSQWCCGLQEEAEIFHITGLEFISSCHGTLLSTTLTISIFSSLLQHLDNKKVHGTGRCPEVTRCQELHQLAKKTCKKASSSFPPFWSKGDMQLHHKRLPICTLGSIFQLGLLISQEARTECAFMWSSSRMTILALSLKRLVCLNGGLLVVTISSTHILS